MKSKSGGYMGSTDCREQNKLWLNRAVNFIIEPMLLEIYKQTPEDKVSGAVLTERGVQVDFMMDYLEQRYGIQATNGKLGTLEAL